MSKRSKREIDFDDLQNEIAGNITGRRQRFLSQAAWEEAKAKQHGKKEDDFTRLHFLLLTDPVYEKLYFEVQYTLDRTEQAADNALSVINQNIESLKENLNSLKEKASSLPDGTKIFKNKDGKAAFTENGRKLSEEEILWVQWRDENPTWEEYKLANESLDETQKNKEKVTHYRDHVLHPAQKKINDPNNPPSKEELKEILKTVREEMPDIVKEQSKHAPKEVTVPAYFSVEHSVSNEARLKIPDLEIPALGINPKL